MDCGAKFGKRPLFSGLLGATVTNRTETSGGSNIDRALSFMSAALELLDSEGAPADVGAHLDLAINRLREVVQETPSDKRQSYASVALDCRFARKIS